MLKRTGSRGKFQLRMGLTRENNDFPITLHYALPRELLMLVNSEVNTPRSDERLRNMALIYLRQDLLQLRRGTRPANLEPSGPTWVDEAEAGRVWVAHTVEQVASELAIEIKSIEWLPGPTRTEPSVLKVVLKTGTIDERLTYEDLSDCPATPEIREELEGRIRGKLDRYRPPPKKIGF